MPLTLTDLDPDVLAELYKFLDVPLPLKATCKATCAAAHKAGHAKTLTKWKQLFPDHRKMWFPPQECTYEDHEEARKNGWLGIHPRGHPPMWHWARSMGGCQEERAKQILAAQRAAFGLRATMDLPYLQVQKEMEQITLMYNKVCERLYDLYRGRTIYYENDPVNPDDLVQREGLLIKPVKVTYVDRTRDRDTWDAAHLQLWYS